MVYFPPPQSGHAQALAKELRAAIADYRQREPKATAQDVQMALHLVHPADPATARRLRYYGLATACVIAAAFVSVAVVVGANERSRPFPIIALVATIAIGASVTLALILRAHNE